MRIQYYIFFLVVILLTTGCARKNFLNDGDYLLTKVHITGNHRVADESLYSFLRQKPNRKFILFPIYLWAFIASERTFNKEGIQIKIDEKAAWYDQQIAQATDGHTKQKYILKKETSLKKLKRKLEKGPFFARMLKPLAEQPVIYNERLTQQTADQLKIFLESKGFFKSYVSYQTSVKGEKAKVLYKIVEDQPYYLSAINYNTDGDTAILKYVYGSIKESYLKSGDVYDEQHINQERERLEKLLKNNGYFTFTKDYIDFEVDTTLGVMKSDSLHSYLGRKRIGIDVIIHRSLNNTYHKSSIIDSLYFMTDVGSPLEESSRYQRVSSLYKNVVYKYFQNIYSKKNLSYKLFIQPGTPYSLDNALRTQRQLLSLDIFRFANIVYDTVGGKFLAHVYTSPLKKMTLSDEWGFSVSQGLPGPFVNLSYKVRNIFHGLENFETNFRYGFEGVSGVSNQGNVYRSQELNTSFSLLFPRIVFPFVRSFKSTLNKYDPKTNFLIGFAYVNRPEYSRSSIRTNLNYSFQLDEKQSFHILPVDINLIYTARLSGDFDLFLDQLKAQGIRLDQSFRSAFVSSINGYYLYTTSHAGLIGSSRYLKVFIESGGTVFNFFGKAFLVDNPKIFGLDYFSFLKFNIDYRYYNYPTLKTSWAYRFNIGLAQPYLKDPAVLPYEKYFFVGGSNSLRAWRPRRLGPGSYVFLENGEVSYKFEQPGEVLLETSMEYRFKVIGVFHAALFADAGNVWTLNSGNAKKGADFALARFYKEIALGAGIGLRLDFSFLLLRLDAAFKVHDPAQKEGERWVMDRLWTTNLFQEKEVLILNLGIGYPF